MHLTLRHKFGLLALLYAIALVANVSLCSWCILLYYQSFMMQAAAEPIRPANPGFLPEAALDGGPSSGGASDLSKNYAARILAVNAVCGVAVGVLGLRLVRRWVMQPVARLRQAALELGRGHLGFRAEVASRDELGELAGEVNSMASSIIQMQSELLQQERRRVAAQALRCIVHNIRSPLTGVRWLAEAVSLRNDVDAETAREQGLIMQAVDEIMSWIQGFRVSLEQACRGSEAAASGTGTEPSATPTAEQV